MQKLFCAVMLVFTADLSAHDFSALEKAAPANIAVITSPAVPEVQPPAPVFMPETRQSFLLTEKCWARGTDSAADALGLPAQFCISRVGIEVPGENSGIFDYRAVVLVEDKDGLKKLSITGYAKNNKDRTIIATLLSPRETASGGSFFAAIYLTSSLDGTIRGAMPEIRGFIREPSGKANEIVYRITENSTLAE
ncbi:MAG: hypothetical protein PHV36_08925 [Elusimicrobiales bacterium]|nr:hypothetical protein [Elusimicrobiales bacterium]